MLDLRRIHHVAIICSNYSVSRQFYTEVLGFTIVRENYRADRKSHKLDLLLANQYGIELFSFEKPPPRPSYPEACGLRHLAFEVADLEAAIHELQSKHVAVEPIRVDEFTGKRFTFFPDPDGLPIELYEQ